MLIHTNTTITQRKQNIIMDFLDGLCKRYKLCVSNFMFSMRWVLISFKQIQPKYKNTIFELRFEQAIIHKKEYNSIIQFETVNVGSETNIRKYFPFVRFSTFYSMRRLFSSSVQRVSLSLNLSPLHALHNCHTICELNGTLT